MGKLFSGSDKVLIFENNCSGCYDSDSYCIGNCPHKKVPHLYCDKCKDEVDELYDVDHMELCELCTLKALKIDFSNRVAGGIYEDMC